MAKTSTRHSLKDPASGKFISKRPAWDEPGSKGFWNWCKEVKPKILTNSNRYEVFKATADQRRVINEILSTDKQGNFLHSISLSIGPRRHFKTITFALIVLWLTTSRKNFLTQLLGNHETHCKRTMFRLLVRIIENSPQLSRLINPEKDIKTLEIRCPKTKSVIQMSSTSLAGSFGEKVNVLWYGDAHSSPCHDSFNAYQASLLDSENALCLIDGNPDEYGGFLFKLEKANDPGIYCNRIKYRDFEHYCKEAPPWIDRNRAKRLESTLVRVGI